MHMFIASKKTGTTQDRAGSKVNAGQKPGEVLKMNLHKIFKTCANHSIKIQCKFEFDLSMINV